MAGDDEADNVDVALLALSAAAVEKQEYGSTATTTTDDVDDETLDHSSESSVSVEERGRALSLIVGNARFSLRCCVKKECWKKCGGGGGDGGEAEYLMTTKTRAAGGTASIPNEIVNLVKNIVGSGGLSLPAGIAAFANAPSALLPSTFLIFIMGIVNAYSFSLIGRVCCITGARTYKEAWGRSYGRRHEKQGQSWGTTAVALCVVGKTLLGCWSFSIVIASTCQPLLQRALMGAFDVTRPAALIVVTVLVLLPLGMSETLSALSKFSVVGQFGTLFTAMTMAIRYFDGSYREGARFYVDLSPAVVPSFGDEGARAFFTSPQTLILISILSTGYVAHYNAPKYFFELKDHTTGRFNVVVNVSFVLSAITYGTISSLGFLTFGGNSAGFILDNYSIHDPLANISRLGIALSVIFSYPLLFLGGRDGVLELASVPQERRTTANVRLLSVFMLLFITILAIELDDLTFVLSFGGATLSSAIIYIFPALMFRAIIVDCTCKNTAGSCLEVKAAIAMMCLGIVMGVCGAAVSVLHAIQRNVFSDH